MGNIVYFWVILFCLYLVVGDDFSRKLYTTPASMVLSH
jgi:hypothetical protein